MPPRDRSLVSADVFEKQNCYERLCVERTCEEAQINRAYKRQALKYHPDKNQSADAEEITKLLNEAKDRLSDPSKRSSYDAWLDGDQEKPFSDQDFNFNVPWDEGEGWKPRAKNCGLGLLLMLGIAAMGAFAVLLDAKDYFRDLLTLTLGKWFLADEPWNKEHYVVTSIVSLLIWWFFGEYLMLRMLVAYVAVHSGALSAMGLMPSPPDGRTEWWDLCACSALLVWSYGFQHYGLLYSVLRSLVGGYVLSCIVTKVIPAVDSMLQGGLTKMWELYQEALREQTLITLLLSAVVFSVWYLSANFWVRLVVGTLLVGVSLMFPYYDGLTNTGSWFACVLFLAIAYFYAWRAWGVLWSVGCGVAVGLVVQTAGSIPEYVRNQRGAESKAENVD